MQILRSVKTQLFAILCSRTLFSSDHGFSAQLRPRLPVLRHPAESNRNILFSKVLEQMITYLIMLFNPLGKWL